MFDESKKKKNLALKLKKQIKYSHVFFFCEEDVFKKCLQMC